VSKYTLPDLAHDYSALEPHMAAPVLELHQSKHHAAHVKQANETLEKLDEARDKGDFSRIPLCGFAAAERRQVRFTLPGIRRARLTIVGLTVAVVADASFVAAVPVFSRKYQTSCMTCHTIFPKLNPYGEAFRLNGYRLPAETEDKIKEKPVSLGADAYKRLWPKMVYPSDLPGGAPFALNAKMVSLYSSSHDDTGKQVVHNDFQFPQEVNLFSAATLGDRFGYFGELTFGERPDGGSDVEIEHARFDIDSPFGPENLVHFRIGKFAPNLYDGFQEMWIMTDNSIDTLFTYNPIGFNGGTGLAEGGGVGLPDRVRGIEMYGVAKHRFFYALGVSNAIGPGGPNDTFGISSHKDLYARLDWKFGGMGLDGDTAGKELPAENWRESSLRVGFFGFTGSGTGVPFDITDPSGSPFKMQDVRYKRIGGFASWYHGDLNVFGVVLHGTDRLQTLDDDTLALIAENTRDFDAWFVQGDYVIRPPFQVSVRYEHLRVGDASVPSLTALNASFSFLIRANIKTMLEYHRDLRDSENYALSTVLRLAF
jgi:Iron/manganese superoxide dismutases, alpha-hairpin domain